MEGSGSKLHIIYISIILILLLVIIGGYFYLHKKAQSVQAAASLMPAGHIISGKKMSSGAMMMMAATPPPLSDQQSQQLAEGTTRMLTKKTFNITGGNFYFVPNKITVNKGDQVTFVLTNAGGLHDLVIDQLGVKTPLTHTAQAATVTFTASKAGSFIYYCSVTGHRARGMLGTLVVQ